MRLASFAVQFDSDWLNICIRPIGQQRARDTVFKNIWWWLIIHIHQRILLLMNTRSKIKWIQVISRLSNRERALCNNSKNSWQRRKVGIADIENDVFSVITNLIPINSHSTRRLMDNKWILYMLKQPTAWPSYHRSWQDYSYSIMAFPRWLVSQRKKHHISTLTNPLEIEKIQNAVQCVKCQS